MNCHRFVVCVCFCLLTCLGCSDPTPVVENPPAQGGSAGQAGKAGSSTGGTAGTFSTGGSGGTADAGLGGKAGSSGTGGTAGSSTGGSAGQVVGDAGGDGPDDTGDAGQAGSDAGGDGPDDVAQGGSAGQAGSDAGDDVSSDAEDAGQADSNDAGDDVSSDAVSDASGDGGPVIVCPTCDELLTWDTTQSKHSTYGSKISTSSNWNDSYAWQMLKACPDWGIVGGHEGGTGDTLQIGACNDGVVLIWAYNMFSSIRLSQGWTGKTDTNLGIGESYQTFIQTYPGYTSGSMLLDTSGYAMLVYANGMAIFKNSVLSELTVW